jgi:hypothetical protein
VAKEEWEAAFYAYRAAQARVSNAAAYLTLTRYTSQVAPLRDILPNAFIAQTVSTLAASRRISRRLAQAWYQYARALDTGWQLGELEDGREGGTLDGLRENFVDRLEEVADLGTNDPDDVSPDVSRFSRDLKDAGYNDLEGRNRRSKGLNRAQVDRRVQEFREAVTEDYDLETEPLEWPEDSDSRAIGDWMERRLRGAAKREAMERRKKFEIRDVETEGDGPADEELMAEHEKAGQVLAGEIHEATADAARKLKEWVYNRDTRVQAVARGTSATPCAFCAMLASRGFVYKNVQSAVLTQNSVQRERVGDYAWVAGFRKIHPNCNCYPIIRWINVPNESLPALNKEFEELWKEAGGLKQFRALMYQRNKKLIDETNSQEE